jgi:hypothetical protein
VTNELKARNQIEAGFESVLFWWSTINKNVSWINYIITNKGLLTIPGTPSKE